jgi:hypothetical protein
MTTKAFVDQELLRKTACPGFIFVRSGQDAAFRRKKCHAECNSIADATVIKPEPAAGIRFSRDSQTLSMIGITEKIPGNPHA